MIAGHFNVPLTKTRSVFTISPEELKQILQRPHVVGESVTALAGGQYMRIADTGTIVGNVGLKFGGGTTTRIAIYTDRAGNLITTFPVP